MKHNLYSYLFALILCLGITVRSDAQTAPATPSGNNAAVPDYDGNRMNYNYLGLLGLVGLYGLHKNRVRSRDVEYRNKPI